MINPKNYQVNKTWIAFRINEKPLHTQQDGDFNCFVLMDAASCFVVSSAIVSSDETELSQTQCITMLKKGEILKNELPEELLVPNELCADKLVAEAERQGIKVVRLPEAELNYYYIREARKSFDEQFGGSQNK